MLPTLQQQYYALIIIPLLFTTPAVVSYNSAPTNLRSDLFPRRQRKLGRLPLLGSLPFLAPSVVKGVLTPSGIKPDVSTMLMDMHKLHGENFKLHMPGESIVTGSRVVAFVSNLEDTEFVLRNRASFSDRGWLLKGLLRRIPESLNAMHEGEEIYEQHRDTVAMAFGRKHLDSYFNSTAAQCNDLGRELRGLAASRQDTGVDITELLLSHVMRNFGTSVLGHKFTESQLTMLEKDTWHLQLGSVFDIFSPRQLRLGAEQRSRRAMKRMKALLSSLTGDPKFNSSPLVQSANRTGLSKDQLNGAIANLFLAGYFTTAFTTKWALWRLALHPEYQQRIYDELKDVGGFNSISSYDDLSKKLPVSRAFIYECMRCFPTVPVHTRRAKRDTTLPSGTVMKKNEVIFVNNFQIFNDPKTWGDDADSFNPDRWTSEYLENTPLPNGVPGGDSSGICPFSKMKKKKKVISKFAYAPFGRGHRACPAAEFSLLVVQMTVLKFVETTKMERTGKPVYPSIGFALGNIGGCYLKLSPRGSTTRRDKLLLRKT